VLQEEVAEKFRAVWQLGNKIRKQPTDAVPSELGQLGEACTHCHSFES
jgi:cytochrome c556